MHSTIPILSTLLTLSSLATPTTAHGFIQGIVVNNHWHPGYTPWWRVEPKVPHVASAGWSALNQDIGFVAPHDYHTADIACHKSGLPSKTRISVNAGQKVKTLWSDWAESHHGPVLTYLARCAGDCSQAKPGDLEWFKIDEKGLLNGDPAPGKWATDTLRANNMSWTVTIPPSLAAGSYVLRQELIALHMANAADGAQSYPQCVNLKISGKGTEKPKGVKANKLYDPKGKGIFVNIYWPVLKSYSIPGPKLWKGAVKRSIEKVWEA